MFFAGFYKGQPSNYIIKFSAGKIRKQGIGISFFYLKSRSTIVSIPVTTRDADFIFNEKTQTFQALSIQGQLTYRVTDPRKVFAALDYSIYPASDVFTSDDPEKLAQRIINAVQVCTRERIQSLTLEEVLNRSASIAASVMETIRKDGQLAGLGVGVESLYFIAVAPVPEIAKALEAEYREQLQKKADEAIYARRAAAVEQERIIKQSEMNSQIEIEKQKRELVDLNGANILKESEYKSKSVDLEWGPYRHLDPRMLVALGLKNLGENQNKIGTLNITPDLLSLILDETRGKSPNGG